MPDINVRFSKTNNLFGLVIVALICFIALQILWLTHAYDLEMERTRSEEQRQMNAAIKSISKKRFLKIFQAYSHDTTAYNILPDSNSIALDLEDYPDLGSCVEAGNIVDFIQTDSSFLSQLADTLLNNPYQRIRGIRLSIDMNGHAIKPPYERIEDSAGLLPDFRLEADYPIKTKQGILNIRMNIYTRLSSGLTSLIYMVVLSIGVLILIAVTYVLLLRNLRKREQTIALKEKYFYGMVHDLKTPLACTDALLNELYQNQDESGRMRTKLMTIEERISMTRSKVDDILIVPKLKERKSAYAQTRRQVYASDFISDLTMEIQKAHPEKAISFIENIPEDLKIDIPIKEVELILRILLDNAVCYSEQTPKIHIEVSKETGRTVISLEDNGRGIVDTKHALSLSALLKKIYRISGNGIGLITAQEVSAAIGATIRYRRGAQGGSIFYLSF